MIYTVTLNPAVDRELTVPEITFDTVLRAVEARVDFGGKGFNVSRLLQGLEAENVAVGFVGGNAGNLLQDGLHGLGIGTDFVWVPGETRTNVSIVPQSHDRYIKANEKGPTISADKQMELLEKIRGLAKPDDWWVLAGNLPPGVPSEYYAQILATLEERGAKAFLDTSGPALEAGCRARPYLAKPNAEEANQITGLPVGTMAEIVAAAQAVRDLGPENVIISMGKDGAMMKTAGEAWLAHSPKIKEANPIGAGDSMVGGTVWALTKGYSLKEALGWGIASGAATASLPGTQLGTLPLIQDLYAQVRFEQL